MYNIILFDLDGTLTDPKVGITKSVQYALKKMDIVEPDPNKLPSFIGPPIFESFRDMYKLSDGQATKAVAYYREYFSEKGMFENVLYEGIHHLLKILFDEGKIMYVATSKPTIFSKKIINFFNLSEYFEDIIGPELNDKNVTKADIIERILAIHPQIDKTSFVMVGDRKHDIIGAEKVGIDSIGVIWGYGSKKEIKYAKPTYIVRTVLELEKLLLLSE